MKTVLVTGASGFTGRYMVRLLEAQGHRVIGFGKAGAGADNIEVDLCDVQAVNAAVARVQPDWVVHLAGIAFVGHGDAEALYRVNVVATTNLLEALAACGKRAQKVLLASSANVYGVPSIEMVGEDMSPVPVNHYGASKLAMEFMARTWFDRLPIILARPFNYTGVGQDEVFVVPKIVSHYRRRAHFIELGNIDISRDFSDVRDVTQAYLRLLESAAHSVCVNVCSGSPVSLREVLRRVSECAGYEIEVRASPAFIRANDIPSLCGDNRRLRELSGFVPSTPLEVTLRWMYEAA